MSNTDSGPGKSEILQAIAELAKMHEAGHLTDATFERAMEQLQEQLDGTWVPTPQERQGTAVSEQDGLLDDEPEDRVQVHEMVVDGETTIYTLTVDDMVQWRTGARDLAEQAAANLRRMLAETES